MPNYTTQCHQRAKTRLVYTLRMLAQGLLTPSEHAGICYNVKVLSSHSDEDYIDTDSYIKSLLLPCRAYTAGLAICVEDMVGWVAEEYWPAFSGSFTYPVTNGISDYIEWGRRRALWQGEQGRLRRELCSLIADVLEREVI